jgi:menaquinone-dependent protoporphyrinogen IX oxidase
MKSIIIYCSTYGSTEKYAKWIAEEFRADIVSIDKLEVDQILEYDFVILGSKVLNFGTDIKMRKVVKENMDLFLKKKVAAFLVGGASVEVARPKEMLEKSFGKEFIEHLKAIGYMRGAMDYDKMSFKDKVVMKIGSIMMPDKVRIEKFDYVEKENIDEFLEDVKKI